MKTFLSILLGFYRRLLALYPRSYREEFAKDMFLDFSDLARDASKRGTWALMLFCLHELIDFPVNLLKIHLKEASLTPTFRPGAARNILRIALALGLALALKNIVVAMGFMTFKDSVHLAAKGSYQDTMPILLSFLDLILGPMLVAAILLMIFPEIRPIKRYLPAIALALALPAVPESLRATVLQNVNFTYYQDTAFALAYYVLVGLGFGVVVSLLSRERRKALWLLFAGPPGFILTIWVSNVLTLRLYHEHTIALWMGIASLTLRNLLMGMAMGLLLGIVLEFKRRDTPPHLSQT